LRRNPDSEPVQARSWVSQCWVRGDAGWQLRLLQSTRMDPSVGG
jgi:hypothetical protein